MKLLLGELTPDSGTVFRFPNSRIAYVAQHSLKHLEKHLHKTPCQYFMWRFAGFVDREALDFKAGGEEDEDVVDALRAVKWCVDGKTGEVRVCEQCEMHTAVEFEQVGCGTVLSGDKILVSGQDFGKFAH